MKLKVKKFCVIYILYYSTFRNDIGGEIMLFKRKKKAKPYRIDTSQKGFEYVGIKLTDQQFQDVCDLNLLWSDERKDIPAFNMLVLMKVLGLLPPEMVCDSRSSDTDNNSSSDIYETLERKFGKVIR